MTDEAAAPNKEPPPPAPKLVTVAVLDAARVLQGTAQIPETEVDDTRVVLPNGCDLEPGKHVHNPDRNTFVPLAEEGANAPEENPHTVRAIALGFIGLHEQGLALPPETMRWLDWVTGTLDFMGPLDAASAKMVRRWIARKGR